ncbi:hypothetical protein QLX08_002596 [Tetragonisca angustula]|uniref:J domain-containing protein n=1 Tax=Tetragonisca angustula TaxID=166442 RepID=A0AAW1AB12_9HYME
MAQISRVYKSEIPVLIHIFCRNYSQQRRKYNYYEILHVSSNATQKEIKDAYIKLSKQMHPDSGNKGNHDDFVKINEAYTVLSSKQNRHYYDIDLKNDNVHENCDYQRTRYDNRYRYAYDMQYSTSIRKHSEKNKERAIIFFFFLLIVGVSLQVIRVIIWSKVNREAALRKSNKILVEHENNLKRYSRFYMHIVSLFTIS